MSLSKEKEKLEVLISGIPEKVISAISSQDAPMYTFDLIFIGALKRAMSLAGGFRDMANVQNMICARALLRMQLDTLVRLFAYTYVDNPNEMAMEVLGGKRLDKFKSKEGNFLKDYYLLDRFSKQFPWAKHVYKYTSGYVHFSEKQVFASVKQVGSSDERTVQFEIGEHDPKFPDSSWIEVLQCMNQCLEILGLYADKYAASKTNDV